MTTGSKVMPVAYTDTHRALFMFTSIVKEPVDLFVAFPKFIPTFLSACENYISKKVALVKSKHQFITVFN